MHLEPCILRWNSFHAEDFCTKENFTGLRYENPNLKIYIYVCIKHSWTSFPSIARVIYLINRLTPNDPYMGRTAPLTSKRCILYIYSTNIGTEYFKHTLYSPFFSLQNAVCFIILTCLVPVLSIFYIQGVLKLKKIIPAPKG